MGFCQYVKERDAIPVAPVYPVSTNNTTQTTGVVDMSKYNRVSFLGVVGAAVANNSVIAYLQESDYSNGASATNISGAAITAVTNNANFSFTIECNSTQLTKRYVKGVIGENAAIATVLAMVPIATELRYPPATSGDVATVVQRVAV